MCLCDKNQQNCPWWRKLGNCWNFEETFNILNASAHIFDYQWNVYIGSSVFHLVCQRDHISILDIFDIINISMINLEGGIRTEERQNPWILRGKSLSNLNINYVNQTTKCERDGHGRSKSHVSWPMTHVTNSDAVIHLIRDPFTIACLLYYTI